ncbi:MAG: hypothetical protein K8F54_00265 [Altibacter sp.]|uniref:hypothetical protein n=1 Tax=Altibacter sp. TaxID=2024823 RepID=UPI001D4366F6|nr:hypothetical protein [Altibacter sp.]MBZ0326011.1 hypothetical protein [Altibacter sp.]
MKKLQAILLATVLLVGSVASAAVIPTKDKKSATSEEIRVLLTDPTFTVEEDTSAYVTFMLNKEGEMIVLTVETEDAVVESFVKARLNYHKLSTPLEIGKEYKVPIVLKA